MYPILQSWAQARMMHHFWPLYCSAPLQYGIERIDAFLLNNHTVLFIENNLIVKILLYVYEPGPVK
jgi:hypothetical protein